VKLEAARSARQVDARKEAAERGVDIARKLTNKEAIEIVCCRIVRLAFLVVVSNVIKPLNESEEHQR
jgi:hypothetical protein